MQTGLWCSLSGVHNFFKVGKNILGEEKLEINGTETNEGAEHEIDMLKVSMF